MFCCPDSKVAVFSLFSMLSLVMPCGAQQVTAQAGVAAPGASVAVSQQTASTARPAGVATATTVAGPVAEDDQVDNDTFGRRVIGITGVGVAGAYTARKVGHFARGTVNLGRVHEAGPWGAAIKSLPVVGHSAGKVAVVPTTLGQLPVLGPAVKSIPVAGRVIAGPAHPVVVGAVAVDTYVIPKYSPCGYTKSSVTAATNDFNTPPKLRHYVNYLAPQPYSHPPIYSPSTLKTDLPADVAYIDAISESALADSVDVPKL